MQLRPPVCARTALNVTIRFVSGARPHARILFWPQSNPYPLQRRAYFSVLRHSPLSSRFVERTSKLTNDILLVDILSETVVRSAWLHLACWMLPVKGWRLRCVPRKAEASFLVALLGQAWGCVAERDAHSVLWWCIEMQVVRMFQRCVLARYCTDVLWKTVSRVVISATRQTQDFYRISWMRF